MNDIRFAFRQLLKNPGFTAVAVLTLALGLGANVSMFSIFNAASWHPLPGVKSPREVVYAAEPDRIVHEQYEFYRDQSKSFAGLVGSANGSFRLGGIERLGDGAVVEKIRVRVVTGDYFGVLGAETPLGRYFLPAEYGEANGPPVIVLSHRFWLQHFNGDPGRIGQTLRLEGEPVTIVGVAPESFPGREPSSNFMEPSRSGVDDAPDAWSPLLRQSSNLVCSTEGRMTSGSSADSARVFHRSKPKRR